MEYETVISTYTKMKMQKLYFCYYKSIKKMHKVDNVAGIAESIATDIVKMVFGKVSNPGDSESLESDLAQFTTGEERQKANRAVWKDGNSRYPHINRVTGMVALYENPRVLNLATSSEVLDVFRKLYDSNEIIYAHGPPIPIVKPANSGKSPGIIFTFQDTSPGVKYSGILCLTDHSDQNVGPAEKREKLNDFGPKTNKKQHTGELQKLTNFELYYDLFDALYNFRQHTRANDIIYLDWGDKKTGFNVQEANQIIEEYTSLYNYYVRNIPSTLHREIRWEVARVFNMSGGNSNNKENRPVVPEQMKLLSWETITMSQGDLYIFTSRDVVRTLQNERTHARIYLHFSLEPKHAKWDSSEQKRSLKTSYETGQFGNWAKPGLRFYLRENSTEHRWRQSNGEEPLNLSEDKKSILGIL